MYSFWVGGRIFCGNKSEVSWGVLKGCIVETEEVKGTLLILRSYAHGERCDIGIDFADYLPTPLE